MTIKDELIRLTSKQQDVPEAIVLAIVSHQFDGAHAATLLNNSIEISGFGKFIFNQKRALKQMDKYNSQLEAFSGKLNDEILTEAERHNLEMRINTTNLNIKHLKPKMSKNEAE